MVSHREEVLVAGVEARLALKRKEERSLWTKGIILALLPPAFLGSLLFCASLLFIPVEFQRIYTLAIVIAAFGWSCFSVIGSQRKRVNQLEERVSILEANMPPNQALVPTPASVTPAAGAPVAPDAGAAHL